MSRSKSKSKSSRKYTKTLMDLNECMSKTLKEIRKSKAYKRLIPYGVGKRKIANPNQKYHFGSKSTMRKAPLCEALSNPKAYHKKLKKAYGTGKKAAIKNTGPRKRYSRKGDCRPFSGPNKRTPPCRQTNFPHRGLTTSGKSCCYKKKQSQATKDKRARNKGAVKQEIKNYNNQRGITQSKTRPKRRRN